MVLTKRVLCKVLSFLLSFILICSMLFVPQTKVYAASDTNYALNTSGSGYPTPSASFTFQNDDVRDAVDGTVSYADMPSNRWTSYQTTKQTDWFQIDFGATQEIGFAALYIYDDGGGVKAPSSYNVQYWDGTAWVNAQNQTRYPASPKGGVRNDVEFTAVTTQKIRIELTNQTGSGCGLTELGLYQTRPLSMPQIDYSLPTFTGTGAALEPTAYTNNNMMQSIYDSDMAAGGTSFWMDRMLARQGNDPSTSDNQGNMLSKGRSIWMGWHDPSKLGFVGEVAYIDDSDKDQSLSKTDGVSGYTIDLTSSGLTEDVSKRVSYPSYWTSEYNDVNGLNVNIKKFFTENNVAVSVLNIKNNSGSSKTINMTVTSPRATTANGDELIGEYKAPRGLTTVYPRISGDGLTAGGSSLAGSFTVAPGQTVSKKVVMGFITNEIPESTTDYNRFKGYEPGTAFTTQLKEYNQWWADNIPYIDVPDTNIKKMIYYRWWLDRFNIQDDELSISKGYAFPTMVEGVTGYNNAITLPLPWQLEESRYLRNPDLNYGTWLSMGATAGGGAFKDNPASPFWTYGPDMKAFVQYITEAGWESYKVFGGQDALLSKFAGYGYNDVKDFMAKFDSNNDYIITLPDGSWTGFDSDSPVTKYFNKSTADGSTGGPVDSLSTSYEYANAQAASEMYSMLGNTAKATEMKTLADNIKTAVLTKMWDSSQNAFLHKDAASSALNPWKDITNFYPFSMGLVPTDNETYKEMLKLWANQNDFVVWPALIGDIQDSKAAVEAGNSMTYNSAPSSMGVTLSFLAKAVKDYPSSYITADTYKQLLYWGAWGMYAGGNTDYPDANEFWSDVTNSSMGYRSWIHHNMHSKYNVSVIEDVAGLTPRSDNNIELDPIDIGWGHFTVNNLRYHGSDMSIIWNGDSNYSDIPQGYSVYIDGKIMFTAASLKHLVWNASTGDVTFPEGGSVAVSNNVSNSSFKTADQVSYTNDRVATMFQKVGINIAGTDPVTGVTLDSNESVNVNETKQLTATVQPYTAQNLAVTWHSSNPDIAAVDQYGHVTGISEGPATITVTTEDGGFSATCTVNVTQANAGDLSSLVLDKDQMSLSANETTNLTASVQGTFNDLTNIALNKRGTGYPTPSASYTCGGDNVWYAVNGDDSSGQRWTSWNSKNASDWFQIDFGTSKDVNRLGLDFYNDGGGVVPPASYKVQYWDGTAFVDVQNMNQSPSTPSASSQNVVNFDKVNTQIIRVVMTNKNPVDSGSYVGIMEIGAYYDPYYSQGLSWNSDNINVVTVDQDGNVTGKSVGTANITVATQDGKHQAQCAVIVNAADKTLLSQKITYAQGLTQGDFTSESWAVLQNALSSAEDINYEPEATQTVVDTALSSLNSVICSLKYKTDHSTIDFSSGGTGTLDFGGGNNEVKRFQTFIARPGYVTITGIDVKIQDNNATSDAAIELYNADSNGMPTGSAIASATVTKSDVDNSIIQNSGVVHVPLNYSGLTAGSKYAIALGQSIVGDTGHDYKWYSSADTSNPSWWQTGVNNPQIKQDGQDVPSGKFDGSNWADESRLGDYWLKVYTEMAVPITPTGLTAAAAGSNGIYLAWTPVAGAEGYNVYISSAEDGTYTKLTDIPVITNSFNSTGLSPSTTYYYKVTTVTGAGESDKSAAAFATTAVISIEIGIPTNLTATAAGSSTIDLIWTPVPGATGYNVYRAAAEDGAYTRLTSTTTGPAIYVDTGLNADTTYYYKVTTVTGEGESVMSTAAFATTAPIEAPIEVPKNLTATSAGTGSIKLTWTPVTGATGYNVYISTTEGGTFTRLTGNPVATNTYISTGLNAATTYYYKVTAATGAGESDKSIVAYTATTANGGTSSSGSGSGSTPPPVTLPMDTTTTSVVNNGSWVIGTTTTEAKSDVNGKATATVTKSQITDAVTKAVVEAAKNTVETDAVVEIKVSAAADTQSVQISIPGTSISEISDNKINAMTITSPIATIMFDDKALSTISKAAETDVKVTATKVNISALSEETKQAIGDRPVFSFSVTSGDKVISEFGGNAIVTVPYTLKPGEDKNAIVIYYINAVGKAEIVSNCAYDTATGKITFKTTHFSQYVVGYNKVAFSDVAENSWYSNAISFVAARGITTGTGDNNYSPDGMLTRGQFLVMVMKAYGQKPDENVIDNFTDAGNTYYTGYLAAAKRLGITAGIGNNKYAPNNQITRQEMFTLLYNVLKLLGELPTGNNGKTVTDFTDAGNIAPWANNAMTVFVEAGIVSGSDNKLTPVANTNRAQMAQILYNLLSK